MAKIKLEKYFNEYELVVLNSFKDVEYKRFLRQPKLDFDNYSKVAYPLLQFLYNDFQEKEPKLKTFQEKYKLEQLYLNKLKKDVKTYFPKSWFCNLMQGFDSFLYFFSFFDIVNRYFKIAENSELD